MMFQPISIPGDYIEKWIEENPGDTEDDAFRGLVARWEDDLWLRHEVRMEGEE